MEDTGTPLLPLVCNLANRRAIVVGGGSASWLKVKSLVSFRARVIVVAPTLESRLMNFFKQGILRWWKREFKEQDLNGAAFAVAATQNHETNRLIVRQARMKGVMAVLSGKSFQRRLSFCSSLNRGNLTIGISTAGKSPALAKYIRQVLDKEFPPQWSQVVNTFGEIRRKTLAMGLDTQQKNLFWDSLMNGPAVEFLLTGQARSFRREVKRCFSLLQE